jgi:small conductance mechanosensitive channel
MDQKIDITAEQVMELMITYAFDVIGALIILAVGWMVASWASRKTRSMIERTHRIDSTLAPFLSTIVRYVILAVVIVAVLGQFGVETASIIAVLGTVGLAVGLALQGTLSNLAAGVVLLVMRPFRAGEYIDSGSQAGTVREVGLFATILRTFDGVFVYVPNGQLVNTAIKNYTRSETRRIDVVVGISYQDDVEKALSLALSLLESDGRVLKDPPPETMVVALGASSVDINLRCWVNGPDYFAVLFDINKGIKQRLEAEGITIPFPQRDLHIVERTSA